MENEFSLPTSALKKGLAVIIGEIVFGVNGPFLFDRFGLNLPLAIASGVVVGAAFGYCVAALALGLRHRERAAVKHAPGMPVNAPLR